MKRKIKRAAYNFNWKEVIRLGNKYNPRTLKNKIFAAKNIVTALLYTGEFEDASVYIFNVLSKDPCVHRLELLKARVMHRSGKTQEAIEYLAPLLNFLSGRGIPNLDSAYAKLELASMQRGDEKYTNATIADFILHVTYRAWVDKDPKSGCELLESEKEFKMLEAAISIQSALACIQMNDMAKAREQLDKTYMTSCVSAIIEAATMLQPEDALFILRDRRAYLGDNSGESLEVYRLQKAINAITSQKNI